MKHNRKLEKAFGLNEFGMVDFPKKISGTQTSRIVIGNIMGCSFCFPHGYEVVNARWYKIQRCWKSQRKTQWKN